MINHTYAHLRMQYVSARACLFSLLLLSSGTFGARWLSGFITKLVCRFCFRFQYTRYTSSLKNLIYNKKAHALTPAISLLAMHCSFIPCIWNHLPVLQAIGNIVLALTLVSERRCFQYDKGCQVTLSLSLVVKFPLYLFRLYLFFSLNVYLGFPLASLSHVTRTHNNNN